jgi:3-oxoacyl-[acyl-carrier protein] reductase
VTENLAVVTGGAGGLGEFIVRALARQGRHVLIADRDPVAGADLLTRLHNAGGAADFLEVDASEADGIHTLIARSAELGRLRLLINNAGGWLPGPQYPDTDDWGRSLDLNLRMPMLATQLALPLLKDGGAVVNVASSGGTDSGPYGSPEYGAAKAGLIRFTTAVADFANRYGVRVSCVVPHWIGLERAIAEYAQLSAVEQQQTGGLVDPKTVVDTILQLADDKGSAGRVVVVRALADRYASS